LSGACVSAHAGVLLQEGFDDINVLPGWVMTNASTPGGLTPGWFQGDQQLFASHSGAPQSYLAANYNNAPPGGDLSNWLITPLFSTETEVSVSLWLRGLEDRSFFDQVAFGFSTGGTAIGAFNVLPVITVPTGDWTRYTINLGAQGAGSTGRFGIQYIGEADNANYIGIDELTVTQVPEPASMLLLAAGMMGFAATRRRRPRG
jgi:hypothetical protein